jgi:hypothetical protein
MSCEQMTLETECDVVARRLDDARQEVSRMFKALSERLIGMAGNDDLSAIESVARRMAVDADPVCSALFDGVSDDVRRLGSDAGSARDEASG